MNAEPKTEKKTKYIPSLAQLQFAAARLPDPAEFKSESYQASIDGLKGKTIDFERIALKKSDGTEASKWSYKGRIFIDSKYIAQK